MKLAGGVMLTAASAPLTPATQGATVTAAAAPTQLVFTTPARTVTAGACSQVLTVQARDSFNNPRTVAAATPVVLGGAALHGGEGKLYKSVIGVFIIVVLSNALNLANVHSYWQQVAIGVVLIAAAAADRLRRR